MRRAAGSLSALVATGCLLACVVVAAGSCGGGQGRRPSGPPPVAPPPATPPPTASPAPSTSPAPARLLPLPRGVGRFTRPPRPALIDGPRDLPVPILMYHLVADPPPGAPYPGLYVAPRAFADQMRYLAAHRYSVVTLRQVVAFWRGEGRLPAKPVVLSFDDGYRCDYTTVAPILQHLGWPGVLNLCVKAVKAHGDLPEPTVRALIRRGWEIDAHSLTHPDLTTLDAAQLRHEVAGSRSALRALFGRPVDFFCYPDGAFDATVIAAVKAAGFSGATTTIGGEATPDDLFTLHRIRVAGSMDLGAFAGTLP